MKALHSASKSSTRGKLYLTIVEAQITAHALPSVISNGSFQSYVSLVCNKQMYKTACAQGNLGAQNPVWMHAISDVDVINPERDSVFISVFASQLGGNQFKNIGTAQIRLDLLTN
jgi:Ca2+-dependent lipid-binding protein